MITAHNLCLSFGSQKIFDNVSFILNPKQRIGLVGYNGSGKSTLLKALVGEHYIDSGTVSKVRQASIAYLPQDVVIASDRSILDETFSAFAQIFEIQEKIRKIENRSYGFDSGPVRAFAHHERGGDSSEKVVADNSSFISGVPSNNRSQISANSDNKIISTQIDNPPFVVSEGHSDDRSRIHTNSDNEKIMEELAELHEQLASLNPDYALAETKKILMGLGFTQQQFKQSVGTLSIGWRMRIVLAKLLLQKADFYLFDEPTNHLDIVAKQWFLQFLKKSSFGFMIVCHDRYFLNQVCDYILELERGNGKMYTGNYSTYERQKESELEQLEKAYNLQQKDIANKLVTINRFRASATKAKMAQSMIKALDKIERLELPPSHKHMSFSFGPLTQPGRTVLRVLNAGYSFGSKIIFEHATFEIERGEKVALIAPNGAGKTTLFNVITGKYPGFSGTINFGHNVKHAIFDQDQNATLDGKRSILENIIEACPNKSEQSIRTFLGSFLFSAGDVNKKVQVLSGGEKNRVGMVKVLLQDANFLLLDEPTNHLDIPSKDILLTALQQSKATIFFVSHEQDFINQLATRIIELTPTRALSYHGNYESYLYQKQEQSQLEAGSEIKKPVVAPAPDPEKVEAALSHKEQYQINKKLQSTEKKIEKLEQEIATIQEQFAQLQWGTQEFTAAQQQLNALQQEHEQQFALWETLTAQLQKTN